MFVARPVYRCHVIPRRRTTRLASEPDGALADRIASGDEQAFDLLVERHRRGLARYCARVGVPSAYVDDVVQQTLMQLWIALRAGRTLLDVQAWLYRVARNASLNELRRLNRDAHAAHYDAAPSAIAREHDPERRLLARETLAGVAALPAMQREAVVLSGIEGRSHGEVAAMLGVEDGAVRGLLYRARVALRAAAAAVMPGGLLGRIVEAAPRLRSSGARLAAALPSSPSTGGGIGGVAALTVAGALVASVTVGPLAGHSRPRTRAETPRTERVAQVRVAPAAAQPGVHAANGSVHAGYRRTADARRPSRAPAQVRRNHDVSAPLVPVSRHTEARQAPTEASPVPSQNVVAAPASASPQQVSQPQSGPAPEASQPAQGQAEVPSQGSRDDGAATEPGSDDGTGAAAPPEGPARETDDPKEAGKTSEAPSGGRTEPDS